MRTERQPEASAAVDRTNVRITLEAGSSPLKHRVRIGVQAGAYKALGRVLLWEAAEIGSGASGLAQLHMESPVTVERGDRLTLTWCSPPEPLGIAEVLEPAALPFLSRDEMVIRRLAALANGDNAGLLRVIFSQSGERPKSVEQIAAETGLHEGDVQSALSDLVDTGEVQNTGELFVGAFGCRSVRKRWLSRLTTFHKKSPLRPGIPREEMRKKDTPPMEPAAFAFYLAAFEAERILTADGKVVRLPGFEVRLRPDQQRTADEILALYKEGGWQPPGQHEIMRAFGPHRATQELWEYLTTNGRLLLLDDNLLIHGDTVQSGLKLLQRWFAKHKTISAGEFRDAAGSSRRAAVPFLEWCDVRKYTVRFDDARVKGPRLSEVV